MNKRAIVSYVLLLIFPLVLISAPPDATKEVLQQVPQQDLDAIPANAPMVFQIRGVESTMERLNAFLKTALPEVKSRNEIEIARDFLGFIGTRKLAGLAPQGPHFIASMELPLPNQNWIPNKILVAIKIKNFNDFRDAILSTAEIKNIKQEKNAEVVTMEDGTTLFFIRRPTQVLITPDRDIANLIAKKFVPITVTMSKSQIKSFLDPDISSFINLSAINKDYSKTVEHFKKKIQTEFDNFNKVVHPINPGASAMIRSSMNLLIQSLEDSRGLVFSMDIRPTGFIFHSETELKSGTKTALLFKDCKTETFDGFTKLPAGKTIYIARETHSLVMADLERSFFGLVPEDKDKALNKRLEKFLTTKPRLRFDALSFPLSGIQKIESENPQETKKAFIELLLGMGKGEKLEGGILKQNPTIKKNDQKESGVEFDKVTLDWDLEKMMEAISISKETNYLVKFQKLLLKKALGLSVNIWIGCSAKEVLLLTGKSWETAKNNLTKKPNPSEILENISHYPIARKDLPQKSSLLLLLDPLLYLKMIAEIVVELEGLQKVNPRNLPELEGYKPVFVGLALVFEENRLSTDGLISSESVKEIYYRLIKPFLEGNFGK